MFEYAYEHWSSSQTNHHRPLVCYIFENWRHRVTSLINKTNLSFEVFVSGDGLYKLYGNLVISG